ncbi:hypothetical protein RRG08_028881 [Elysia crispata]|uniref:Uncharacterized protein n=1 Tax=Elysia crispata TaxID=231223 RepID=A0AAE0YZ58_9GAST|nr:hypothetical protein RRG08_028881 [Elysia crispata]
MHGRRPRGHTKRVGRTQGEIDLARASRTGGVLGSVRDPWPKGGNLWPHVLSVWPGPRPLGAPPCPSYRHNLISFPVHSTPPDYSN